VTSGVVVGAGPNGLAAAVALARSGIAVTVLEARDTIGGGTRTEELTVPGVWHDVCSAIHPLGVGSPFLRSLDLARHGLEWCWPEIDLAHPLDSGRAGVLVRNIDETAAGLGSDGVAWQRLFGRAAPRFDDLGADILRPVTHLPRHPMLLAEFGTRAVAPATWVARRWQHDEARGLFGGMAAHAFRPLSSIASGAVGLALALSAHRYGWPVARGGSRAITDALAAEIRTLGATIETGCRVTSLREVDSADVVMLDLSPAGVLEVAGDRLPTRIARAYRRYRYGPAAYKVDLAVEGGVQWTNESCRRAGTVHLGGRFEEVAAAESDACAGRMPQRPFVLVGQQYLADPTRSAGNVHPVWMYAHVPNGYRGEATGAVLAQLERFAPGVRERIVGQAVRGPVEYAAYNPNFVNGDISTGANDPVQMLLRPRVAIDPYRTGIPGVYMCSAATPPGGGVHGMCGANAAASALRHLGMGAAAERA
jgi:phytoene dehydrogenase-like protein